MGAEVGTMVTKRWVIPACPADSESHDVQIRHDTVMGDRVLLVDGKVVHKAVKFLDDGDRFPVKIGDREGIVTIAVNSINFAYTFEFDGKMYTEQMEDLPPTELKLNIAVTGHKSQVVLNNSVVMYTVVTSLGKDLESSVDKRFSEVAALDAAVRTYYIGNHLLANIPKLPPKSFKWWTDHSSAQFCEGRARALDNYFRQLIKIPRMSHNPELREFLFPDADTRQRLIEHARGRDTNNTEQKSGQANEPTS